MHRLHVTLCDGSFLPWSFFFVRPIYSRASLRGEMRDRQMPTVSDRHEAKTEAQSPSGDRRDAIRKT
jgi:hypothetical protein